MVWMKHCQTWVNHRQKLTVLITVNFVTKSLTFAAEFCRSNISKLTSLTVLDIGANHVLSPNPQPQAKPHTLHPQPYTLYTFDHTPYTLHPKPQALNPTINPKP